MPHLSPKQRLIVCLDGTWNNRDDTTNVFHHLTLAYEGAVQGPRGTTIVQRRFYHPGVGTGVLDKVSGGGFGFGLEENVRAAYNWLVENFQEHGDGEADEIYIFGFSRGAYTARSLVGFISRCGLLRRGAPLTVNQLWEDYCILGREHEQRRSFWDTIFGEDATRIRQLTELIEDPWNIEPQSPPPFAGAVPGQRVDDLTDSERLLVRWSRRVRITYLGVYDTVGALGFDALAIPGLKSKLALHHNMRPTTLVQSCRHALALHEHRTSFRHTPMLEYIGHEGTESQWIQRHAMWRRKIEQRWFVGAHANIGGGYAANELAQRPFRWILDGAENAGLCSEPKVISPPAPHVRPRDSYAEFLAPIATHALRVKRFYRRIDPPAEARASRRPVPDRRGGFSLVPINEHVDASVFEFVQRTGEVPPNLVDFARRRCAAAPGPFPPHPSTIPSPAELASVLERSPCHPWLGEKPAAYLWLGLWATIIGAGLAAAFQIVFARPDFLPPALFLGQLAAVFVFVDLLESRLNFALALGGAGPMRRAARDAVYWLRAMGVALFMLGASAAIIHLAALGWNSRTFAATWLALKTTVETWWLVPTLAGAGVAIAGIVDRPSGRRAAIGAGVMVATPVLTVLAIAATILGAAFLARLAGSLFPAPKIEIREPPAWANFAGVLLLLQLGVLYFLNTWDWAAEPMNRANLGSIVKLQRCWRPTSVQALLDHWAQRLTCSWALPDPAAARDGAVAMRNAVRQTLWRDIVGFIPVYGLVLLGGSWFAAWLLANRFGWDWLQQPLLTLPRWMWPIIAAVLADWAEDVCQLVFLRRHELSKSLPSWLTAMSGALTAVKIAGFVAASALTLWALAHGSWVMARLLPLAGWRGTLAVVLSGIGAGAVVLLAFAALFHRETTQREVKRGIAHVDRETLN